MKTNKIIKEALTWLNTPYHRGAKIKGVGVDCGQFLIAVFENTGVIKKGECNPGYYPHEIHLHRSEEEYLKWILKYCDQVDEPQPGDVAMFRYGKSSSHSGIYMGDNKVIHSYVRLGVIISDLNESLLCDDQGESRLTGFYRLKGLKKWAAKQSTKEKIK